MKVTICDAYLYFIVGLKLKVAKFVSSKMIISLCTFSETLTDTDENCDNGDGRSVQCQKCHKEYRSLSEFRLHAVKCSTINGQQQHLPQETVSSPTGKTPLSPADSSESGKSGHREMRKKPPPLIPVMRPDDQTVKTMLSCATVSHAEHLQMAPTINGVQLDNASNCNGSVPVQLQTVNSSHFEIQRRFASYRAAPISQRPGMHAKSNTVPQVVTSNGLHPISNLQKSINGPVQRLSHIYPNKSSRKRYTSGSHNAIAKPRPPLFRSSQTNPPLSIMLPPDVELPSPDNITVDKVRKCNGVLKNSNLEQIRNASQETGVKANGKVREKAKLTEERRIRKLMTVQPGTKLFQCNICKRSFSKSVRAKKHIRTHLGVRPFKCTICGKSFNQAQNLRNHVKRHGPQEVQQTQVNTDETTTAEREVPSAQNPPNDLTTIELEEVPEETAKLIQVEIEEADRPYKCGTCPMQFSTYMHLEKHVTQHKSTKLSFCCNVCNKQHASQESLEKHLQWHKDQKHYYPCDKCSQIFYHTQGLNEHMVKIHNTGDRVYSTVDNREHVSEPVHGGHLNQHHHLSQGMRPQAAKFYYPNNYSIDPITRRYDNTDSISTLSYDMSTSTDSSSYHDGMETQNEPSTEKQPISFKLQKIQMNASSTIEIKAKKPRRYFKCSICTSTFYKDSEYNKHMMEHEEGMTFTCMACDITFSTSSELNRHYATHPGKRSLNIIISIKKHAILMDGA